MPAARIGFFRSKRVGPTIPSPLRRLQSKVPQLLAASLSLFVFYSCVSQAQERRHGDEAQPRQKRGFSVGDDIAFSLFGSLFRGSQLETSAFSPDARFFIVNTERGRLRIGKPESTVRVFRTKEVKAFLAKSETVRPPSPIWTFRQSGYKDGPLVSGIRWLPDSSGFAFLAKVRTGNKQLLLARLKDRTIRALTPETQDLTAFDIRDPDHFAYTVLSPAIGKSLNEEAHATSVVGTGRDLYRLLFPGEIHSEMQQFDRSELWAVLEGRRFRICDGATKRPLPIYLTGQKALTLSPDGRSVVTALPVATIPPAWETLYPPAYSFLRDRIRPHEQDLEAFGGHGYINQYVSVDLHSQAVKHLTNAPIGSDLGWTTAGVVEAAWSPDQKSVVLSNTFIPSGADSGDQHGNRLCVAVYEFHADTLTCLESSPLVAENVARQEFRKITSVEFSPEDGGRQIVLHYVALPGGSPGETSYLRANDGAWRQDFTQTRRETRGRPLRISLRQGFNVPPVLLATDTASRRERVIWDPNPQLKDIDLGEVRRYQWKTSTGHESIGGLYKPPDYIEGRRYPLVIQTHGFPEHEFIPSGIYPSAFAARELAAAGMMVLQVSDIQDCAAKLGTPGEASCVVADYEAAVAELVKDGLVDSDRIGIIGFSRTSYYVMQALTTSALHFKAASITDGFNGGYFQYLTEVDLSHNAGIRQADAVIGAPPFGEGLQRWIEHSPEFNISKVTSPLQVVALNRTSLLVVWEPYAELRALNRPVDLLMLPGGTHVLSNPAGRLASQGGTVDWFRFWLQQQEDPAPEKQAQYVRWRQLRKLQEQNQANSNRDERTPPMERLP